MLKVDLRLYEREGSIDLSQLRQCPLHYPNQRIKSLQFLEKNNRGWSYRWTKMFLHFNEVILDRNFIQYVFRNVVNKFIFTYSNSADF